MAATERSPAARAARAAVRLVLGAALLAYVLWQAGPLWWERWRASPPWLLPALAVLALAGTIFEAGRLRGLLRMQQLSLAFADVHRVVLRGTFFSHLAPGYGGGDAAKLVILAAQRQGQRVEVATALLFDRVVALLSFLVLASIAGLAGGIPPAAPGVIQGLALGGAGMAVVLLLGLILVTSRRIGGRLVASRWIQRVPGSRYWLRLLRALHDRPGARRHLAHAFLWSLPGHGLLAALLATAGTQLLPGCPISTCISVGLLGLLANLLPLTPGGLGVGEWVFEELFSQLGFAGGAAVQLSWRVAVLPVVLVGGVLVGWRR